MMTRREFIKLTAVFGGSIFAGCGLQNSEKKLSVDYLRQIISNSENSRCIMWQTDSPMNNPAVEIKLKNSADVTKISAVDSNFTDDGENILQYTANIEKLQPSANYEYRIIDGEYCTDFYNLKTSADKFKAIIFPDSQSADYNVWGNVAKTAFENNPDADFFVNVGDIVDNGEDKNQWRSWMDKISLQMKNLPFVPVMGNHETYTRDWNFRLPISYLNYFAVPDNGIKDFSRRFYSFDYGPAHFVILDTQWNELENFTPNMIETQKNWLIEDLQKTDKIWRIAFLHKDVLQYKINGRPERLEGFSDVGLEFMPLLENLNFDVVFTAHLHTYRNRGRLKNFQADNNGPLYILTGVAGDVRYSNLWINHGLDKIIAPQPEIDNYLTMEVDNKNLLVKCFLNDSKQIDEFILKKEV